VQISAYNPATTAIEDGAQQSTVLDTVFTAASEIRYGFANSAAPLRVVIGEFSTRAIGQSFPLAGGSNMLTVTLTCVVRLAAGSAVSITGLAGSLTANSSSLPVVSAPEDFESTAAWENATGTIVLTVGDSGLASGTSIKASFWLRNPLQSQTSPSVSISSQVASLAVDARGIAVVGEFTAPIALTSMVKSSDARLGLAGHAAPLRVHVPHFDLRSIGQSTPLAAASNMLTVTLQANCDFPPATSITLAGLNSTQGAADNALAVAESTDGSIAGGTGAWDPDVGTLVVSVGDNGWSLATTYVLSFWVQNSATANDGAKVLIGASVPSTAQDAGDTDDSGEFQAVLLDASIPTPTEERHSVPDMAVPLRVFLPVFTNLSIGQSYPLTNAANMLTVTLQTNCDFSENSTLTLSGLVRTRTTSTQALAVVSQPESTFQGDTGTWDADSGTLVLTVGAEEMLRNTTYVVSFWLRNPSEPQEAPAVELSGKVDSGMVPDATGQMLEGELHAPVHAENMTAANETRLSVGGASAPLHVFVPVFVVSDIGQSTPLADASNMLTVTLRSNCDLEAGTNFTLSGLVETQTESGNTVPITVSPEGAGLESESWDQAEGNLVITSAKMLLRNQTYVISFWLRNNPLPQAAVTVKINGFVPEATAVDAAGTVETAEFGAQIPVGNMLAANETRLAVSDTAAPLRVFSPMFVVRDSGQSLPLADASNMLTVTLLTNCDMAASSEVTLSGLVGTQTANGDLNVTSSPAGVFGASGIWSRADGVLRLVAGPDGLMRNTTYVVSFFVRNGATPQAAPYVNVSGVATVADVPDALGASQEHNYSAPVHAEGLRAANESRLSVPDTAAPLGFFHPVFPVKRAAQSSPLLAASNLITLTLQPNCDIHGESTLTLSGLLGTQPPSAAAASPEALNVSCDPAGAFAPSGAWDADNGTLVLLVTAGGLLRNTSYALSFWVRNGDSEQPAQVLDVEGTVHAYGAYDALGAFRAGTSPPPFPPVQSGHVSSIPPY